MELRNDVIFYLMRLPQQIILRQAQDKKFASQRHFINVGKFTVILSKNKVYSRGNEAHKKTATGY